MNDSDAVKVMARLSEVLQRQAELDRKLDEVLAFTAAATEAVAPFLTGKGGKWLALVAKARRPAP